MEKKFKIMFAVVFGLLLVCLVLGCLTSTGHIDWEVKTDKEVTIEETSPQTF